MLNCLSSGIDCFLCLWKSFRYIVPKFFEYLYLTVCFNLWSSQQRQKFSQGPRISFGLWSIVTFPREFRKGDEVCFYKMLWVVTYWALAGLKSLLWDMARCVDILWASFNLLYCLRYWSISNSFSLFIRNAFFASLSCESGLGDLPLLFWSAFLLIWFLLLISCLRVSIRLLWLLETFILFFLIIINFKCMSVYSGFATRQQETFYNKLLDKSL